MTRGVVLKLGGFAGTLALLFGGAFVVGRGADPVATAAPSPEHGTSEDTGDMDENAHGGHSAAAPVGLAVSEAGYTLVPQTTSYAAPGVQPFRFTIQAPDGKPLASYRRTHEKDLHLIVVRRDLSGFQHVHPTLGADGVWSIPVDFATAGTWRVFADFAPADHDATLTLGTDVNVGGAFTPVPLPEASTTFVADGYEVTLSGDAVAGREAELTFTVRRNGAAVADLQPYLGAFGHLVSLRTGDLAYLHTHPVEEATAGEKGGPEIRFGTTFPTAGTYRLFLDFQHGGEVHTAEFTLQVGTGAKVAPSNSRPTSPRPATPSHESSPHGH
jgi:hypothetical protein